jgi:WD40 repeat protein
MGEAHLWDLQGKRIKTFKGFGKYEVVASVSFSADGKYSLTSGSEKVVLWNNKQRKLAVFKAEGGFANSSDALFSPNGKLIIHTIREKIRVLAHSGKLLKELIGHTDYITDLEILPDGKTLVSSSRDMTVRLWNLESASQMVLLSDREEWISYMPQGYFDSSPYGGSLITIVNGMNVHAIDQFAVKINRPDLLLASMELGSEQMISHFNSLYHKRLNKLGLKGEQNIDLTKTPKITIEKFVKSRNTAEIHLKMSDRKYQLVNYNIYINNVPIYPNGKLISGNLKKVKETVKLSSGKNKVEVSVFNEKGIESPRAIKYAVYNGKTSRDIYFLGFGISQYQDGSLNLAYADKDVLDLADHFKKYTNKTRKVYFKTFINQEVTAENIMKSKAFLEKAKTDDIIILFIAGHGVYEKTTEATYYFLTYQSNLTNLAKTAISFEQVESLLSGLSSRNKLFLMDTCESGELEENKGNQLLAQAESRGIKARTTRSIHLVRKKKKTRSFLYNKDRYIYNDLRRRTGAIIFSSSRGGELSYESKKIENGFFSQEIINALNNKRTDANRDRQISVSELQSTVSKNVASKTGQAQHPTIDRDNIYQKISFPLL